MRPGHQWFKLSNVDKTQTTPSTDQPLGSPTSASPPPSVIQALPETTAATSGEVLSKDGDDDYLGPKALYILISSLMLVVIILTLDQSILATAVPYITNEFHTITDIGWYGAAYLLCTASLQPLTGKIYTYFSLKYSFLAFLGGFELGSLICALAKSSAMLVIGRAVAGMGASGLINGALTILTVAAPPSKRPTLLAIIMAMAGAGQLLGPLVGGALTQHVSWRWCFWINLPIGGLTAVVMLLIRFPPYKARKTKWTFRDIVNDFDLLGFAVFAPSCIMLLLALQWGGITYAWSSATLIGLIGGSVGGFSTFALWEYHHGEAAMIPFSLVRRRVVYSSLVTTMCQFGGLILQSYYLPLWFQTVKGDSPTMSAVDTLPTFLTQILFAVLSGALTPRIGYLLPLGLFGNTFASISAGLLTTLQPDTSLGKWVGYQILGGMGRGVSTQQPLQAVQSVVTKDMVPVATATLMWSQTFGGAILLGLGQTAFLNFLRHGLKSYAPQLNPAEVIGAGATNIIHQLEAKGDFVTGQQVLRAYNYAITHVFYLAMGCAIAGFFATMGLGKTKVEKKASKKKVDEEKGEEAPSHGTQKTDVSDANSTTCSPSVQSASAEDKGISSAVLSK
ncbi:uncharacterized protein A1O9_03706 [Exophiala aquamarina CBS 119918]|uniref:Major facilitator superfamily (MFS) profile domain-containing protein n=1 Tax=Exophiala aquamarina CBS 119918 TaxID=1182545 RepID=A0A072PHT6_9EURO|nr:uncharacterized protein A1O9_03706 [Exophiala aquamarina CBS 119918]KEF58863.1 hypothetical protein A1O9_03706 [Exophiala aquamarina CBS 119918]